MWEWLRGAGTLIGGLGTAYGAIESGRMNKKLYNLQKSAYDRNIKKENKAQMELEKGFNSVYGKKKKKQPYMNLEGGTNELVQYG